MFRPAVAVGKRYTGMMYKAMHDCRVCRTFFVYIYIVRLQVLTPMGKGRRQMRKRFYLFAGKAGGNR